MIKYRLYHEKEIFLGFTLLWTEARGGVNRAERLMLE